MKIAIAQLNPTIGDLMGNAKQILNAAKKAAEKDVRLLLTPELSLCGYPPKDLLLNPGFIKEMAAVLQQLALDLPPQLAVLAGMVELNERSLEIGGKPLFNSIAWLERGKVQQIFHKRLLPTYDVFDEYRYFEPGLQPNYFTLHFQNLDAINRGATTPDLDAINRVSTTQNSIRIGVTICEDLWNDEEFWGKRSYAVNPIADLAQLGVDIIVNLSASPYTVGKQRVREAMLKHAAIRYQQPIVYTNQVGGNDDLIFDGSSVAFNRAGEVVCRARSFETDLAILSFDEQQRDLIIPSSPNPFSHEKREELAGAIAQLPQSEDEEIWNALVLGVRDYIRKCGFSQVVLGLSGGIDSALVAAIAATAIMPENVLGVLMPSPYSSEHSVKDALELANNLGIQTQIILISELMQGYDETLAPLFSGTSFGLAEENIQSRIRGNLLMAISNKFGHLLISTGNKSEMAVGYCTLYGDMNGGLAAIADVPKTRVYSLCQWLNTKNEIIPANILIKPPSAELKPEQTDADSLPTYDILDDILQRFIHEHQSLEQIVAAGHDRSVVNKVVKMVVRAEFKRRQAPPGLKITDRAFGTGWRMPIASRSIG